MCVNCLYGSTQYKNYKVNGEGSKRFAIWSGSEHNNTKESIKVTFNNKKHEIEYCLKLICLKSNFTL